MVNEIEWVQPAGASFKIGKYPVTIEQYNRYCDAVKSPYPISAFFTKKPVTGVSWFDAMKFCEWAGVRLPTVEEWELAENGARPGKESRCGTCNMNGTVWQWCYGEETMKPQRGGSNSLLVTTRTDSPYTALNTFGFRVAIDAEPGPGTESNINEEEEEDSVGKHFKSIDGDHHPKCGDFVLVVNQKGEGCDYSIGCGMAAHIIVGAETIEDATKIVNEGKVLADVDDECFGYTFDDDDDNCLGTAFIVQVAHVFDVKKERANTERVKREIELAEKDAEERQVYERLKAKFEGP